LIFKVELALILLTFRQKVRINECELLYSDRKYELVLRSAGRPVQTFNITCYQSKVIQAEFRYEQEQSIATRGMSRNDSQAATINPFHTPNNVRLRTKQLVRNLKQEKAHTLRELCKTIAIKKDVKIKLTKPQKGIHLAQRINDVRHEYSTDLITFIFILLFLFGW
jgi:hypothetical protein